ncbi:T9SS type B sorting domain-containing protein [Aureitalea sp. L0-47]|uniref:T9SS type B sorting domain-containing protein n=1 Tax=Aureitalea sp. L0-47 TaxID=2816962 RepID=UPI0022370582|nr:T9SS type B sorting domain-containing protein [Aureitalea sp. L0-47]MCW5519870.1 T9SS type B sorting domain-containing protein [Aureitalea sp. L0-47]
MRSLQLTLFLSIMLCVGRAFACPSLIDPVAGASGVPVDTTISWEEVPGVTGYIISLGTTPGGGDIINQQPVGSETQFTPPLGLPEFTQVFVTITLFIINQPNIVCPSVSFTTENVTTLPECTTMLNPVNGETGVNIETNIAWAYAPRAIGYRISLGTTEGSGDIVDNIDVGNVLNFNPPMSLPSLTEIFVSIIPYNEIGGASECGLESFTTAELGDPPGCTSLIRPANGSINVPLDTTLEWIPVPGADGYIVSVGSSPYTNDVLDMAIFINPIINVINFEPNKSYFVVIIPFNQAGQAQGCIQESFSTILGCGPLIDPDTGKLVSFFPTITFPEEIGICEESLPTRIDAIDQADGYRWYRTPTNEPEFLISDRSFADLSEPGQYRFEAYNVLRQNGFELECPADKVFTAILSSKPQIETIFKEIDGDFFNISVIVSGIGNYEYSLNSMDAWQSSSNYDGLTEGDYTIYVRDEAGCGITEQTFRLAFPAPGFPAYFSPNGDGINDNWNYIPPKVDPLQLSTIYIYDRFGKVLASFSANGKGWDGIYDGTPMPLGGYWYVAEAADGQVYRGHFSLIR